MRQLTQLIALVFTRQTIGFALLTVAALLVWFLGPGLAVDGLRPLASDFVRISCVLLLVALAVLWLASGPLSLVAVGAVCLLIWHAGPSLSLGDSLPLAAVWLRLSLICVLVLGCVLYWLHRLLTAMRTNDDFLAHILAFGRNRGAEEPAAAQLRDVALALRRAIAKLKKLRLRGGVWGSVFDGRRYLYELPWYLVLGSPGAGKTTALRGAGLQFPLTPGAAVLPGSTPTGGVGDTSHCDWWLANEAVLIDTAGRYATQTDDPVKDPSEWLGFLALLRKYRARAPINGAIVALSMSELLRMTSAQRAEHAVCLRERLLEVRRRLGISFPVYLVVTKTDVLRGFTDYFQSLTSEGRSQPWGFTLSYRESEGDITGKTLRDEIGEALRLLEERLADGLRARMSEEFDGERRRALFALPMEFSVALSALREVLDPMLLDSRFDTTQSSATLRGVYFTSGAQVGVESIANPFSLVQRLCRMSTDGSTLAAATVDRRVDSAQGFFLQDVFKKVIFPEAHLVRPNLRWELRFRAMRLLGHLAAIAMFVWIASALASSFENNRDYLEAVGQRTSQLTDQVRAAFSTPSSTPIGAPEVLGKARALTTQIGLDTAHPPMRFTFGLYTAPPVVVAGSRTYAELQTLVLLPSILRRMERVLALSLKDRDNRSAYETLRVYKLLHDSKRYIEAGGAASVREWVRRDAQATADAGKASGSVDGADLTDRNGTAIAELAGRASLAVHFDALFAADRLVQAASLADESLVRAVQGFLDDETATQRIYERAKLAMQADAPPEFTLIRAVGPQVGTVFARHEGLPLDKGVPGLFTFDGYHLLFAPRIAAFVRNALLDDDWVMGRSNVSGASATLDQEKAANQWVIHVRKQYLDEYTMHWDAFLASVRTLGLVDNSGGDVGLGFDLGVLRQLAAPDSPLSRLARAAVHETTLSQPRARLPEERGGLLDKAVAAFGKVPTGLTSASSTSLAAAEDVDDRQLARDIVDSHFAALREIVTGSAEVSESRQEGAGGRPRLEAVIGLINDFYTWMVVADSALSAGGLPPGGGNGVNSGVGANGGDAGSRLKLEAGRLPAPFKEILAGLATSSAEKVAKGATDIFRRQAQLQLDRLMALMALQVSEPCKRGVEGRYPFASVAQDASVEDFTLVFSSGGALDEFFSKYLASFVDTSVRPWRYKSPDGVNLFSGGDALNGTATTVAAAAGVSGPGLLNELLKLLARDGPNLDAFYRAQQIRNVFFRDPGGRKMAWKMEIAVRELEPSITELLIDIDGQGQRYVHGPVQPLSITWPGPRGGVMAEMTAQPRISSATSTLSMQGPWALFRLLDKGRAVDSATPGRSDVEYVFDGRKAVLELGTGSQPNPLNSDLLKGFRCPGRAA